MGVWAGGLFCIKQSDGQGKVAVSESGCSAADAAEPSARRQGGEQSMLEVGGVGEDPVCSGSAAAICYILDGGERGLDDLLRCPHHSLQRLPV